MELEPQMSPTELATLINAQTDALTSEISNKLAELQRPSQGASQDNSALIPARPRILSALYCLCLKVLRESDPGANPQQFNQFMAGVRAELKRLHPDWKGPFTFESTLRQGEGMYLRDAPNITELVRSKPDFVFEEEWHLVQKSGDHVALFALKAKIQILESLRILTHNPAHVMLTQVILGFISRQFADLRNVQPVLTEGRTQV